MSKELLKDVLEYFDRDTTNVPMGLYKNVFNYLYPPKEEDRDPYWTELGKKVMEAYGNDNLKEFEKMLSEKSKPKEELKEPEVSKFPIRFSKEASDFIQTTFNKSGDYYWTDFKYRKIGDTIYELHPPEKTYTQEQVNKMMEDAFNAARQIDFSKILPPFKVSVTRYPTFQDYLSSLK